MSIDVNAVIEKFTGSSTEPVETPTEVPAEAAPEGEVSSTEPTETVADVPSTETTPVETPAEPARDAKAAKFAALARQEKQARQREAAAKEREEAVKKQSEELEARLKALEEKEGKLTNTKNPLELLKAHGFKFQDALEASLGNYKEPEPDPVQEKLSPIEKRLNEIAEENAKLRKAVEEAEKLQKVREQKELEQAFTHNVTSIVKGDPEKFELLNVQPDQGLDLIRETMYKFYEVHKKVPSIEEACEMVEEWLYENHVKPYATTKKLQSRLPKQEAPKPQAPAVKEPTKPKATSVPAAMVAPTSSSDTSTLRGKDREKAIIAKYSKL